MNDYCQHYVRTWNNGWENFWEMYMLRLNCVLFDNLVINLMRLLNVYGSYSCPC